MLSGDETLVHGAQLRRFVTQHSGYCGGSEDVKAVEALWGRAEGPYSSITPNPVDPQLYVGV